MPDAAGDRRPADDRRQRPGRATDDDVLGRRPLEQHHVDDHVERDRQKRQERRDEVDEVGHDHEREDAERQPEHHGALGLHLVGGQRASPRPGHEQVDVAIEVAVDRVRAAGGQRPAEHRPEHEPEPVGPVDAARRARQVAGREDHRRDRRDQQELDDPRLGQGDVGADRVARADDRLARPRRRRRRRRDQRPPRPAPAPCSSS